MGHLATLHNFFLVKMSSFAPNKQLLWELWIYIFELKQYEAVVYLLYVEGRESFHKLKKSDIDEDVELQDDSCQMQELALTFGVISHRLKSLRIIRNQGDCSGTHERVFIIV